jgi:hypothetical protein
MSLADGGARKKPRKGIDYDAAMGSLATAAVILSLAIPLTAQQAPPEPKAKAQPSASTDPWQAPAASKVEQQQVATESPNEYFTAQLIRATERTLSPNAFVFRKAQTEVINEARETRLPIQLERDLEWSHLRAFLVRVEREGLPWRVRRLQLRAPADSAPWADETPYPKTLHVEELEFARRQQAGRRAGEPTVLAAGTAVLRALQELARAAAIKDLVIGELTLMPSTPEAAGNLTVVLWLTGRAAAAQITQLNAELKKAIAAGTSPFAKVESMLGPTPRAGVDGGTTVTLSIALKPVP